MYSILHVNNKRLLSVYNAGVYGSPNREHCNKWYVCLEDSDVGIWYLNSSWNAWFTPANFVVRFDPKYL